MTPKALLLGLAAFALSLPVAAADAQRATSVLVRNNLGGVYSGAVETNIPLEDGMYSSGSNAGIVSNGRIRMYISLPSGGEVLLRKTSTARPQFSSLPLSAVPAPSGVKLQWRERSLADMQLGFAVITGKSATAADAIRNFTALALAWNENRDGSLTARMESEGFALSFIAHQYPGSFDLRATVVRVNADTSPAYVALIRRVSPESPSNVRLRFNGRIFASAESPDIWDRDFWYTRGVDWTSWDASGVRMAMINGFTPVPTILKDTVWGEGSHFYVWERTRKVGEALYFVSEIAGPNVEQAKSRYMPVTPYAALRAGDTVSLKWRLAVSESKAPNWEENQLRGFAGYRSTSTDDAVPTIDLGVRSVTFGTSYFPYSTFGENFDYYRVRGMTSEAFWPTSAPMWSKWKEFVPRMRTDLRIARAMGFEVIRPHHLELIQKIPEKDRFPFLDFFADELRSLGLKMMVDSEGPPEWITAVVGRYSDIIVRVELENEVLIGGITPSAPARWTALYNAAKKAAPSAHVFLTGAGNNAMFNRLVALGVPFDRVGLHAYKHGPQWKEAFSSHAMGTGGFAADMGKPMTLGEFNWKDLTRMSPESRVSEVAEIYEQVLSTRSVPELYEFQFHESLTFNPSVSGTSSRHYEPLALDRRPKPEAAGLLNAIRKFGRRDAHVNELPFRVDPVNAVKGRAISAFSLVNRTGREITVRLKATAIDGISSRLITPARITLKPGQRTRGSVRISLDDPRGFGTYHHFIEASYDTKVATGWGVVSNEGPPTFSSKAVLGDRVHYREGPEVVGRIEWSRPIGVVFGETASVLELESAYQLGATLQASTGKKVRISSAADIPDGLRRSGLLFVVGTPRANSLVGTDTANKGAGVGIVTVRHISQSQHVVLTGADSKAVQAAVVELQMRYWPNARVATMRMIGFEKGAALGNRIGGFSEDPP